MTKKIEEKDLINIIIHLISSSKLLIDEPKEYGPMRLFSAAKFLCKFLRKSSDKNTKIIVEKIIELDPKISRELLNKPEELKICLDDLSKLIAIKIRNQNEQNY